MRTAAKFGGTSLGSGDRINRAADSIVAVVEYDHETAVVTSAMGLTTDDFLDEIKFEADDRDRAKIVSMGERANVRMLKAALAARGVNALFVEPGTDEWSVITNDFGEVDVEATRERVARLVAELDGIVLVITGFLAQSHDGEVTMLGRGSPDISAMMFGNYMDADEVATMTDVEGVMTGDPRVVEGACNVGRVTVDEPRNLSFRGVEAVAPLALSYKGAALDVHVAHYQHGDLPIGGTLIEGEFHNFIDMQEESLACLTVAGWTIHNRPGILADLSTALREEDISVDSVASGTDSITLYVLEDGSDRAETVPHDRVAADDALSSVTVEDDVTVVRVTGGELPNRPGVILDIVEPLSEVGVNIHDATTSVTPVAIFVAWDDCEETLDIIQDEF